MSDLRLIEQSRSIYLTVFSSSEGKIKFMLSSEIQALALSGRGGSIDPTAIEQIAEIQVLPDTAEALPTDDRAWGRLREKPFTL
jgi:hypothetical protein